MLNFEDPLHFVPVDEWNRVQDVFRNDWPRGAPMYYILERQKEFLKVGADYGFKLYCPYGDPKNGIVAINDKGSFYEVITQSTNENTSVLEDALRKTNVIDKTRSIIVPYAPLFVIKCYLNILTDLKQELDEVVETDSFIMEKHKAPFQDVKLPIGITFGNTEEEHIDLINSKWPRKYNGSEKYFQLLNKSKSGFGLFKEGQLITWVYVSDGGSLTNLYTLEEYRKRGYAELIVKLVTNELLKRNQDVFSFCIVGNVNSYNLFKKLGFTEFNRVAWLLSKSKLKY